MSDGFGPRLRAERQRKGIALDAIANRTKINVALLEALERDDPSKWPSGIFRRAFIRAYAKEIGADPEATLREFLAHFPDDAATDRTGPAINAASSGTPRTDAHSLRITFADEPRPADNGCAPLLRGWWQRVAAVACDVVAISVIAIAGWASGRDAWALLAIAVLCYHVGGALLLGASPGAWLVARRQTTAASSDLGQAPHADVELASAAMDAASNLRAFRRHQYRKPV
jgi:transcriptional regulator with XRE-family HTH domain